MIYKILRTISKIEPIGGVYLKSLANRKSKLFSTNNECRLLKLV